MFLARRSPASEQHHLHFVQYLQGNVIDWIHILRINFKYNGTNGHIIEKGDTDYYPSFSTDTLCFISRIIPVVTMANHEKILHFKPLRIREFNRVESDQFFHTFAIFDDVNTDELTRELCALSGNDLFSISPQLFPFIVYDYFTACFNVVNPIDKEITHAAQLFEPLFISLYGNFKNFQSLPQYDTIDLFFEKELVFVNGIPKLRDSYREELKKYFVRFKLFRDDELALRGLWRFIID